MGPVVQHADQQEEAAGDGAVGEHLEHGSPKTARVECGKAQEDEAHVADAGISHHFLKIRLSERDKSSVDDPDHGQHRHGRAEPESGFRK